MRTLKILALVAMMLVTIAAPVLAGGPRRASYATQCGDGQCRMAQAQAQQVRYYQPVYRAGQAPAYQTPRAEPVYSDPLACVNAARARRGLHALAYDATLASYCAANNSRQLVRGLGHHILAPGAAQCAAIGTPTGQAAVVSWTNSPAHAALMFSPRYTAAAVAVQHNVATLNLR